MHFTLCLIISIICSSLVWKRKLDTHTTVIPPRDGVEICNFRNGTKTLLENKGGPSRFDFPEVEELTLGVFSAFDDITYNTKPILRAPENIAKSNKVKIDSSMSSGELVGLNFDENCTGIQSRTTEFDKNWIEAESILNSDSVRTSSFKKVRFNNDTKSNCDEDESDYSNSPRITSIDTIDNHEKIIREVLKKYPHLVQHNKNIRLKIMQKESRSIESSTPVKTKVSYIILKSDSLMVNNSENVNVRNDIKDCCFENNYIGPWKCTKCDLDEQYINYHMYRRHMQDVHDERFDPRICEHCGYKATKRNILMYHMYTKHNIPPPKSMSFPKCQMCSHIALSESLLTRHQINHKHQPFTLVSKRDIPDSIQRTRYEESVTDIKELVSHETARHQTFPPPPKMTLTYPVNDRDIFPGAASELEQSKVRETSYEEFRANDTSDKELQLQDRRMSTMMKDKNCHNQLFTNIDSYIMSENDKSIQDTNEEIIVYIHSAGNLEYFQAFDTNDAYGSDQNLDDNDVIVEEVVEELEAIAPDKQNQDHDQLHDNSFKNEGHGNLNNIKVFLKSLSDIEMQKTVQYVEEETEILEYETCTHT